MSICFERLGKDYGQVTALAEVDLEIADGEFITLLGPSGSGKTTLLNLLAGMMSPTSGRILIDSRDVTGVPPAQRNLGMVFQNYALMPHMTIFENIAFPLRVRRLKASEIRARVEKVLALVQLPEVAGRKPAALSGGQQQRIALARALVYEPRIILMDEPLGALDKRLREQMQLELIRIHREVGVTIVFVTHDQEEALTMSDRIVLLNRGRIVQVGTPSELYFKPNSVFSAEFLGDSNLMRGRLGGGASPAVETVHGFKIAVSDVDGLCEDEEIAVMIRPENIRLADQQSAFDNQVEGRLRQSLLTGGSVRHIVTIGEPGRETTLVIEELNRVGRIDHLPGARVTLGWSRGDVCVLRG